MWPFNQTKPQTRGMCNVKLLSCKLFHTSLPVIWYTTWTLLATLTVLVFEPHPGTKAVCRADDLLACCSMVYSFLYVTWPLSEKNAFVLWFPPQGLLVCLRMNICFYVVVRFIPFNLIYDMTISRREITMNLASANPPPPKSTRWTGPRLLN